MDRKCWKSLEKQNKTHPSRDKRHLVEGEKNWSDCEERSDNWIVYKHKGSDKITWV